MPNASPHKARLARKRARKPGNLLALQRLLWRALLVAETILTTAAEEDRQLRAIHAISQASGHYLKVIEVGELEARLAVIEAKMLTNTNNSSPVRVGR
jgi:hypothetical protein